MFAIADVKSDATKTLARVAELVDACASGAYVLTDVEVQVLSRVLNSLSELASAGLYCFKDYLRGLEYNRSVDIAEACSAVQVSRVLNSLSELASAGLFFLPYVIYYQNLSVDLAKQCFAVQVLSRVLNSSTDIASVGLFLF